MHKNTGLSKVIRLCLALETVARDYYDALAARTNLKKLSAFWHTMAREEEFHITCWNDLLLLSDNNSIPNIFDTFREVQEELELVNEKSEAILNNIDSVVDDAAAFLLAYRLEFYLLHPAFQALFYLMKQHTRDRSPLDNYEKHIMTFVNAAKAFNHTTPEMQVFSDIILEIWRKNSALAEKIGAVQMLKNLIPVCASCKRVRTENNSWQEVVYYHHDSLASQVTHWICPDCIQKLYPDFHASKQTKKT